MPELGEAYVNIIPKAPGIRNNMESLLGDAAEEAGGKAGDSGGKKFAEAFGKAGAAVGKATMAAVGAAATGVVAITKSAVESFSEFEQLKGGVETMFDNSEQLRQSMLDAGMSISQVNEEMATVQTSADTVMENAANAFRTAGMSANEYMSTVTSFSASLLQGLGGDTQAAAELADMAITDMADNANKMGTSMESIQNAYQGFAKGNFTMLDNLKLGYGGTQSEMVRLMNDSGILKEKIESLDGITFDQMIQAIHAVQEKMGITGTTAAEASTTIQGSLASMKAAWSNVLTGMADDSQDFGQLIDNLVETATTFAGNIIPRITTVLQGAGNLIASLAPVIVEQLPGLVDQILPGLVSSATSLVTSFMAVLPGLISVLSAQLPALLTQIIPAILSVLPQLLDAGIQAFTGFVTGFSQSLPELIPKAQEIIMQLSAALIENIPELIMAAGELMVGLALGLINSIPVLIEKAPQIVSDLKDKLIEKLPEMKEAGIQLLQGLKDGIIDGFKAIWGAVVDACQGFIDGIKSFFGIASPSKLFRDEVGLNLMAGMAEGIEDNAGMVSSALNDVSSGLTSDLSMNVQADGSAAGAGGSAGGGAQEIVLNVTSEIDGAVLARQLYRFILREEDFHGAALIQTT